jgi:hypothetical protein
MPAKGQDIFMQTSIFLARLLGPTLLLVAAGFLLNRKSLDALARELLGSAVFVILFGVIDFAIGLAIVLTHNVWTADWRVLITLLGWLLILRGAARTLAPDQVKAFATRMLKNKTAVTASLAVALVLGLVLSYFGYAK